MNLSAPFIRRPTATSLLAAALLLAGVAAFTQLPVAPLPRIDLPTINITAALPGASPTTMATAVAMPLERRFGRIAGVSELTSTSSLGTTSITVQFNLDRNIEGAARDIQAAINAAGADLPPNLPTQPSYRKVNPADTPILILSLRSKTLPLPKVFEAANNVFAPKISQVDGVGQVAIGGASQPAVRVRVDPVELAGRGISLEQVRTAVANASANEPKGGLSEVQWQSIGADDQLFDAEAWKQIIVHWAPPTEAPPQHSPDATIVLGAGDVTPLAPPGTGPQSVGLVGTGTGASAVLGDGAATAAAPSGQLGAAVRLRDIAQVTDDVEDQRIVAWFDGEPTVNVIIRRQPGANILDVIERIKRLLPGLTRAIPASINVEIAIDRATTVRQSVHDVELTLVIAVVLVVLVVFVFLRSGRATSIPSIVVPLSLVATFGVMYLLGYSLDNLSLMALTIATGFVVDDAIVVTENIMRQLEAGKEALAAAHIGSREIGFTIVSITASLLAAFIPLFFMDGIVGRFLREFAMTLAIAITISALLSLTLTPMMCSRLLRARHSPPGPNGGLVGRLIGRALDGLTRGYATALRLVLRHRIAVGLVTVATIATTVYLYRAIPFGLFPQQDTGMLSGQSRARQDISFEAMKVRQQEVSKIVHSDPAVDHLIANVGGNGSTTTNTGALFITLNPKAERGLSAQQDIDRQRPKLAKLKGITMAPQAVQDLTIGGRIGTGAQYQYALTDVNLDELNAWGPKVTAALRKLPEIKDVVSDQQTQGLELDVDIDRDTAAQFGITVEAIDNALYDAFGQRQVAVFYTQVNEYRVVLEVAPETGTGVDALNRIYVPSVANGQVPLSALVKVKEVPVALSIGHQGQFPATTISFNLTTGVALGDAVKAIEHATAAIQVPASIHGSFSGFAQAFQSSLKSEPYLILIALLAVYIALGVLYESYVHPITIVSTLPSAGLGALLALELTSTDLSIIALIGIILLIGIVMKNAILMVDFAIAAERDGTPPEVAIYQAAVMRFRPILMTTLAALLGALPLALGTGTGSELRRPLGIAIVGGLIVSQLLNLFTTPVTYLALHRFTRKRPRLHEFA